MIFIPPHRLRQGLVALAASFALSAAHADERTDLEQLRATTLGLIQALVDQSFAVLVPPVAIRMSGIGRLGGAVGTSVRW